MLSNPEEIVFAFSLFQGPFHAEGYPHLRENVKVDQ